MLLRGGGLDGERGPIYPMYLAVEYFDHLRRSAPSAPQRRSPQGTGERKGEAWRILRNWKSGP